MKTFHTILLLMVSLLFLSNSVHTNSLEEIKLNDIQVIGSHNSYKIGIEKHLFDYLLRNRLTLSSFEYEHIPLSEQLNLGLRGLELKVFLIQREGNTLIPEDWN